MNNEPEHTTVVDEDTGELTEGKAIAKLMKAQYD